MWFGKDTEQDIRQDTRQAARQIRRKLGYTEMEINVERQNKESEGFEALFPSGIRYDSFDKEQQEKYDRRFKKGK